MGKNLETKNRTKNGWLLKHNSNRVFETESSEGKLKQHVFTRSEGKMAVQEKV